MIFSHLFVIIKYGVVVLLNLTFWIYIQKKSVHVFFFNSFLTLTYGYKQRFELLLCDFEVK